MPSWSVAGLTRELEARRLRLGLSALAAVALNADGSMARSVVGLADPRSGRAVTTDTVFSWYSLTKIATATLAMQLVEDGLLDLEQPVVEVLPEFGDGPVAGRAAGKSRANRVRVHHLLSHTSGLADRQLHAAGWFRDLDQPWPDARDFLARILRRRGRLVREAGRCFHYSNLGYAALGEVLAEVSGQPFRQLMRQRLLLPAGMTATSFERPDELDVATGTVRLRSVMGVGLTLLDGGRFLDGRAGRWRLVTPRPLIFSPHGGLWGPVGDVGRLLALHRNGGALTPEQSATSGGPVRLLQEHSVRRMQQTRTPCAAGGWRRSEADGAGMGWCIDAGPPRTLFHGGRGPGFTTEMRWQPETGRAVGLLGSGSFDARREADRLLR